MSVPFLIALSFAARPVIATADLPYAVSARPSQDGLCEGDAGKADLDRSEEACLQQLKGVVSRNGKMLNIVFRDGTTKSYVTRLPEDLPSDQADASVEYKLTGYFPEHRLLLIEVGYWEGIEWIVLRLDDGVETKVHSLPYYSPHRDWLFSVCSSDGPSGCGNGMEITPTRRDLKRAAWRYLVPDNDYTQYEFVGWDSDDRVKLVATFRVKDQMKSFPASVERINGVWHLKLPTQHARATRP